MRATVRTAWLMARKDLRVEWRSRVALNQILPFAAITMVLFAFAVDRLPAAPGEVDNVLVQLAPGLASLGTVFSLLLLVQRTFAVESEDGALDALRAAGVDATAVFWGKTIAMWIQLAVLSALLLGTAVVIYGVEVRWSGVALLITTWLTATFGLAAVGTLYGGLAAGARGRETLLPLLLLPVVAPVLIGATRAVEAALGTGGTAIADGWPWVGVVVSVRRRLRCRGNAGLRSAHRRVGETLASLPATSTTTTPTGPATTTGTSTKATRLLGAAAIVGIVWLAAFGLGLLAGRRQPARVGPHPLRPRPRGVAGVPRLLRHRRGLGRSTCSPRSTRSVGIAWPGPAPRSACCSWASRSSSAPCGGA